MQTPKTYVVERGFDRSSSMYKSFKYLFVNPFWTKRVPNGFSVCPFFWLSLVGLMFRLLTPAILGFNAFCKVVANVCGGGLLKASRWMNQKHGWKYSPSTYVAFVVVGLAALALAVLLLGVLAILTYKAHQTPVGMAVYYTVFYSIAGLSAAILHHNKYAAKNIETRCHPFKIFFLGLACIIGYYNFLFEWNVPTNVWTLLTMAGYGLSVVAVAVWNFICAIPGALWHTVVIVAPIVGFTIGSFAFISVVGYYLFKVLDVNYEGTYTDKLAERNSLRWQVDEESWKFKTQVARERFLKEFTEYIYGDKIKNWRTKYPTRERLDKLIDSGESFSLYDKINEFRSSPAYQAIVDFDKVEHDKYVELRRLEWAKAQQEAAKLQTVPAKPPILTKACEEVGALIEIISAKIARAWSWSLRNIFSWFSAAWQMIRHLKKGFCPYVTFKGDDVNNNYE